MSDAEQKRYPNPKLPCPKCAAMISGTTKLRVKHRSLSNNVTDWKLLERFYRCSCSSGGFWDEIKAKPIPEEGEQKRKGD